MSFAVAHSRANCGMDSLLVSVEIHISGGLPRVAIVGLPETAVKESKDRVRSALLNMKFDFPASRITINLAPADLPKDGGRFDLAIALGILAASQQLPAEALQPYEFVGELALSGELRPIKGILPFALACQQQGRKLILPSANAAEASFASDLTVLPADHFLQVIAHLRGEKPLTPFQSTQAEQQSTAAVDMSEVIGQTQARRAIEIAAAGEHSLLLTGPPGTGKTMLASRLATILPPMNNHQALQSAVVHSISNQGFRPALWKQRPFRSPHHSASAVALVGGGNPPRPGEISLAHRGILFLDELPEFSRPVLEALREPMESGVIIISRAAQQAEFPAQFQLVAAMNPCPCGYLGDKQGKCRCSEEQISRYRHKISGPILDRIDMHISVPRVPTPTLLQAQTDVENSHTIRLRVEQAQRRQYTRSGQINAQLNARRLKQYCQLAAPQKKLLDKVIEMRRLSARAYHRLLRVALTIADLDNSDMIKTQHLSEALSYRPSD